MTPLAIHTPSASGRTPAPAPTNRTPAPNPERVRRKKLPPQVPTYQLNMHEVAVTTAVTAILLILPTSRLTEISNRREFSNDRPPGVKSPVQRGKRLGSLILLPELHINIADHVIGKVITDIERLNLAEFRKLEEDILIEILKVLLNLARIDRLTLQSANKTAIKKVNVTEFVERNRIRFYLWVDAGGDHVGSLVHVGEEEGGGDAGAVVEARAAVAVSAGADLEVEGAVNAVLLGAEY